MSKLLKPRYEYYKGTTEVVDNESDTFVEDVVDRLNEQCFNKRELLKVKQNQDQEIADLQHQLEVAEKALELACDCVPCKFCPNGNEDGYCCKTSEIWDSSDDYECNTAKFNHFKEQAEKELKGE